MELANNSEMVALAMRLQEAMTKETDIQIACQSISARYGVKSIVELASSNPEDFKVLAEALLDMLDEDAYGDMGASFVIIDPEPSELRP